ncbi:hypothetical protein [Caudoviricetes sp.]|nr:hypothetical protein [Caudoviricetes sp.]UOF79676.1 hypothetical protein [Caudoviricetes sp.]UOF79850.1 hypothetical protein [Bacteriophage sp.]UOF81347.1 hypothetical protein [Caudoviricetes sp.]
MLTNSGSVTTLDMPVFRSRMAQERRWRLGVGKRPKQGPAQAYRPRMA